MIYDIDDNPISAFAFYMTPSQILSFQIKVDGRTGYVLKSSIVGDVLVEARESTVVPYTAIETIPISLTPYNLQRKIFDVRLTAAAVASAVTRSFSLSVGPA